MDFDVEREMKHLKRIVDKDSYLTISSRFMKYLIEQAERVHELEKRLKIYQKRSWFEDYEKVAKQNKRYRELLEKIKEMTRYDDCQEAEIYDLVSDELEGSE